MTSKTRYFMGGSAAILVAGLGTGLVAYYGGGFPSLSASRSGPTELSYVPADAAVVAFANVREVMDSQLRQRLKLVLPQEQGQKEFQEETGIQPAGEFIMGTQLEYRDRTGYNRNHLYVTERPRHPVKISKPYCPGVPWTSSSTA